MNFIVEYLQTLTSEPLLLLLVAFILMLFVGEPVVLGVAFLTATTDLFPFLEILLIAFFTSVIGECFWFFLGQHTRFTHLSKTKSFSSLTQNAKTFTRKIGLGHPFRLLFYSRLISGLTIAVIMYVGEKGLPFKTFLRYIIITDLFWTTLVVTIGYLAGKGYGFLLTGFEELRLVVIIGLLVFLCVYLVYRHSTTILAKITTNYKK